MEKLISMTQSLSVKAGNGDISKAATHRDLINIGFSLLSKVAGGEAKLEVNTLIAKVYQDSVASQFKEDFTKLSSIQVTNEVIPHLAVFVWGGEIYVSHLPSRKHTNAYLLDGTLVSSKFIYNFDDEMMFVIGSLTQSSFNKLLDSQRTSVFTC